MLVKVGFHTAPTTFPSLVAIVASAVIGVLALGGGRALASEVSCGDTIRADTTLDGDLVNCPSNGIVIGADGISLDLNGHRVAGNGKPVKNCPDRFCDVGVLNDGHDDVTVRDGSVREFGFGVFVGKARHARVVRISSSRNLLFGFVFGDSARSVLLDSSGNDNLEPEGDGLGLFGSHHIRILHNSFRRNAQLGIHVVDSDHNLIEGNAIARNSDMGILMEGDRNQVRSNRCARNGTCIIVNPGSRNVVARNHLFRDGTGIAIEKGRGNLVARNVVVGARGHGIYLGLLHPPIGGAENVVRRNLVADSGRDGFWVSENDHRSLLAYNIASGAGDDGFDIGSRSMTLRGNRAVRNGDLGIEGVRGVIDGGANVGRRNGDPRQCTHISCG